MTVPNLSIVIAPNLLWDTQVTEAGDHGQRDLADTSIVNDIVETLISHVDFFFRGFGTGTIDFFKEVIINVCHLRFHEAQMWTP